jgi:transcriptional regulator with XRE-family HTH domain
MGERFQRLRHQAKMTQDEASQKSGVPLSTLRQWEQGKRLPRIDHAMQLARALGVTLDELTGMDEPPEAKKGRGKR